MSARKDTHIQFEYRDGKIYIGSQLTSLNEIFHTPPDENGKTGLFVTFEGPCVFVGSECRPQNGIYAVYQSHGKRKWVRRLT